MLTQFPYLLDYSLVVPTVFRFVLVWYVVKHAYNLYKMNGFSITHGVLREIFKEDVAHIVRGFVIGLRLLAAALLILGLFTQSAGLVVAIMYLLRLQTKSYIGDQASADILLIFMSLSLLFLGAGAFALDLPL